LRPGRRFDLIQTVESNLSFGRIAYTQFCHRAYLREKDDHSGTRNMRQWLRWLDHRLHAVLEPWTYRQVERIVVPSIGTAHELAREYPVARHKISVIHNPVDTARMRCPASFDRSSLRRDIGWMKSDRVLVFVALGHFERKGLPVLLEALNRVWNPRLKLLVVGGQPGAVTAYQAQVRRLGLQDRVRFTGNRSDVRPYLWSADAFVLPSHYETFSLVAAEAAAAGLPVIAPMLHGIGEWIRDEKNGLVITQTTDSVTGALKRLSSLDQSILDAMGAEAAADVQRFGLGNYAPQWRQLYDATMSQEAATSKPSERPDPPDTTAKSAATSIAIFDYRIAPTNPIGGCHRRMLAGLCSEYDFTVFAVEFDNPSPGRIAFQRVPVPSQPQVLLFVAFHLVAPICYWLHRLRHRKRFDLIQAVESNLCFGTVAYSQFCHRSYLKLKSIPFRGWRLRQWFRWLDHRFRAAVEPWIYKRVTHIIVPSKGTAAELAREYPEARGKIRVINNPVDTEGMRRPCNFDGDAVRQSLRFAKDDIILIFVALGHYERKGLPILLDALTQVGDRKLKLLVVGGQAMLVREYTAKARRLGLANRVIFTGNQEDIRPYLWSADAFVLPSHYEAFPLVVLEAAAAGLPLITPLLNGVEELIRDGENGLVITQASESVAAALRHLIGLDRSALKAMGSRAAQDVGRYAADQYAPRWRNFYETLQKSRDGHLA
jgi:glycosyltransferase involved in cell wall biosynthesis